MRATKSPYPRMTPREYEFARQYFGLSPDRFANLVGVHWRQGARYRSGETTVPKPVAKLIRTIINHELEAEDIG